MLYQEIRPYRFDDMVGQNYIVENVRAQAKRDAWFHSFILAGQFGSGKTTMARIIAMAANCRHKDENGNPCGECANCRSVLNGSAIDFKEIDGASNTGVDNIRDLKEYVSFHPVAFEKKVIIIDEVHKLSNAAFNSLLKVLEEPPEYTIFILCTTEVEAIPETVQSRCAIYRFGAIQEPLIAEHLVNIAKSERICLEEDAALLIAKYSSGAMRNAIKFLEQLSASSERITAEFVSTILGVADTGMLFDLLLIYLEQEIGALPTYVERLQSSGRDMVSFMKEVERACADLILCKESDPSILVGTASYRNRAIKTAENYTTAAICQLSAELMAMSAAMRMDGTTTSFLLQSVALIQRIKAEVLEKEAICKDMNRLSNEVAELKAQLSIMKKNGVGSMTGTSQSVKAEDPSSSYECCGNTDDTPGKSESAEAVFANAAGTLEQGASVLEDGFSCVETETVPFEETTTKDQKPEDESEDEPEDEWEEEDDFFDDDDGLFDEPSAPIKPIRTIPATQGDKTFGAGVSGIEGSSHSAEPIPRKSSEPIPRKGSSSAASQPAGNMRQNAGSAGTVSRVEAVKEKLLEAAKEVPAIYNYIAEDGVFDERKGHVRVTLSPFWKAKALSRFLTEKGLNNVVEVETMG